MTFVQELTATGRPTPLSRYIVANGVLYLVFGTVVLCWPEITYLMGADDFRAGESGLVRVLGFVMAIIGWFYVMGGRTGATSFGLATVVDRAVVPVVLGALAWSGAVDGGLVVGFAILDPVLALGAYLIWRRTRVAT
ncbi:hypothetical protein HMPREF0063_11141 [Aeromicrobium marinum DSM 15272]|uniref:Uncharacterized protein n=1 Tax=Aeromicrobium marinum DSM 15272 TaxID=585531 RepID=E2SAT3_9ACTN|nr:hypothetical protein [Aeromicrobium marinum]EFQ83479.1 hypothetical protein HMPREF0063_11141 [Aeromicrobium marinum DSM 15272]